MVQMTRRKMKLIAMNDSDEESNREDEKIDDSDDGVEDGNMDMKVDGNTSKEVLKKTWWQQAHQKLFF